MRGNLQLRETLIGRLKSNWPVTLVTCSALAWTLTGLARIYDPLSWVLCSVIVVLGLPCAVGPREGRSSQWMRSTLGPLSIWFTQVLFVERLYLGWDNWTYRLARGDQVMFLGAVLCHVVIDAGGFAALIWLFWRDKTFPNGYLKWDLVLDVTVCELFARSSGAAGTLGMLQSPGERSILGVVRIALEVIALTWFFVVASRLARVMIGLTAQQKP